MTEMRPFSSLHEWKYDRLELDADFRKNVLNSTWIFLFLKIITTFTGLKSYFSKIKIDIWKWVPCQDLTLVCSNVWKRNMYKSSPSMHICAVTSRMYALKAKGRRSWWWRASLVRRWTEAAMNASFIESNTAANSAAPDPSRGESERVASKGVSEAVSLLKGKKAANQPCQLQVYLNSTVWGFFPTSWMWVWGTSVTSGSNKKRELAGWALNGSSCLAHCLPPFVRRFNSWLQTRLQLGFRSLSLAVGVKKHLLIWAEECSFCFRGTESKLGWEVGAGSLWSAHRRHERSHLPFSSLVYR